MPSFRPESGAHRDLGPRLCWLGTCLDRSCTVWPPSRTAGCERCRSPASGFVPAPSACAVRCLGPWDPWSVRNDITRVREIVAGLAEAGFRPAVFGGWAEELHRVSRPRPHRDIDLLVVDPDMSNLDVFVGERGEIGAKSWTHKRAFIAAGVLVELFIVNTVDDRPITHFWGTYRYEWPDIGPDEIDGLPVASVAALDAYRHDHALIGAYRP